jgi:hypothetical protein
MAITAIAKLLKMAKSLNSNTAKKLANILKYSKNLSHDFCSNKAPQLKSVAKTKQEETASKTRLSLAYKNNNKEPVVKAIKN